MFLRVFPIKLGTPIPSHSPMQIRSTSYAELPIRVNGSVNVCPAMGWCPVHGGPCFAHHSRLGLALAFPATPNG